MKRRSFLKGAIAAPAAVTTADLLAFFRRQPAPPRIADQEKPPFIPSDTGLYLNGDYCGECIDVWAEPEPAMYATLDSGRFEFTPPSPDHSRVSVRVQGAQAYQSIRGLMDRVSPAEMRICTGNIVFSGSAYIVNASLEQSPGMPDSITIDLRMTGHVTMEEI